MVRTRKKKVIVLVGHRAFKKKGLSNFFYENGLLIRTDESCGVNL